MQSVTCDHWLPFTPDKIYATLTDTDKLAQIVKRLESIEVLDRNGDSGDVMAVIDLPGGKKFRTLGHVEGIPGQRLAFQTDMPVTLNIIWELSAETREGQHGAYIQYTAEIDFKSVAAFVSKVMLHGYLSSEMQRDLETLESILTATVQRS
jgi:hypothetical protein